MLFLCQCAVCNRKIWCHYYANSVWLVYRWKGGRGGRWQAGLGKGEEGEEMIDGRVLVTYRYSTVERMVTRMSWWQWSNLRRGMVVKLLVRLCCIFPWWEVGWGERWVWVGRWFVSFNLAYIFVPASWTGDKGARYYMLFKLFDHNFTCFLWFNVCTSPLYLSGWFLSCRISHRKRLHGKCQNGPLPPLLMVLPSPSC